MSLDVLIIAGLILTAVVAALVLLLFRRVSPVDLAPIVSRLDSFEKSQERTERTLREEMARNRDETGKAVREQRQ